MGKNFRCGRLMLTKDGTIKKLRTFEGGGSRVCNLNYKMSLQAVHHRLLNLFKLNNQTHMTSIYDFHQKRLHVKQYQTFGKYIQRHGLHANSTVIYLCTRQVDDDNVSRKALMEKREDHAETKSTNQQKTSKQTQTTSSVTSFETQSDSNHESVHRSSSSEYSWKKSSDQLMKYVRELIDKNGLDDILTRLYEYICILNGYICLTINPFNKRSPQSLNAQQTQLHVQTIKNSCELCQSMIILLELNKDRLVPHPIFASINQLYEHLQNLRDRWVKTIDKNSSTLGLISTSSSNHQQRSLHSHVEQSSYDQIDDENSIELLDTSSSSSSCQILPSSPLIRDRSGDEIQKQKFLFRPILNCCHNLLNLIHPANLPEFREIVRLSIRQIEHLRLDINLSDKQSIDNAKQIVLSLQQQFTRFHEQQDHQSRHDFDRKLIRFCNDTLNSISILFTTLDNYRAKICKHHQKEESKCLSSVRSFIDQRKLEDGQLTRSNKRTFNDDDD